MAAVRSLSDIASLFRADFSAIPVMATEIEFYLPGLTAFMDKEKAVVRIREVCAAAALPVASVAAETGKDQFEVAFAPSKDIPLLAKQTDQFKALMYDCFSAQGVTADFAAKPFADQPGSGLHIHFHLENAQGRNLFTREGREMNDAFSDELLHSLGGMLALMNASMVFFVPAEQSYARFIAKSNAPLTVSWGTNNRTVALRLPTKALDNKHIEHRVAGSDADVTNALGIVAAAAHYGLKHRAEPGEPIYGDAALPQYKLPGIAKNKTEAEQYFAENLAILQPYLA